MNNQLRKEFLALRQAYIQTKFSRLNQMQQNAVYTGKGPLLILAGAGSGKTTVLVNRIANLVLFGDSFSSETIYGTVTQEDIYEMHSLLADTSLVPSNQLIKLLGVDSVRPYNVMAITFTNKAAGELKERLKAMLGEEIAQDINAATFHSTCVRILRRECEYLGYPKEFTIYDQDDQQRKLKEVYKILSVDDKFLPVKVALSNIGRLKDKMISPKQAAQDNLDVHGQLVSKVYIEYQRQLKKAGAMDFDDLIYNTVKLFSENAEVLEKYQNRFKYILVDEYQDTSTAQFMLVEMLARQHKNICVVGDDDQSIYRFRGATIENILSFEKIYPNAKVIRLEENYRSTSNILNAANSVIKNNVGRKGKTLWTSNGDGEKICHYTAENQLQEAANIASTIQKNVENGAKLSDHAVLYRMNALSEPVENYFARAGIPYRIIGGRKFFDRKEVKDMLCYLTIVVNPLDDLRLKRIINEPARKIGATTIGVINNIALAENKSIIEILLNLDNYPQLTKASVALQGFIKIYTTLVEKHLELPLVDFVAEVATITGYEQMLLTQGEEGKTRLENIGQLVSSVSAYATQNGEQATLAGFLEDVALITDLDNYDDSAETVVLMTVHSSKGLEFKNVFIVGMEEGIFPSDMCRYNPEDLEEERRLCYVAITRAKQELVISTAQSRMMFGQTKRNTPSRFLNEIDKDFLQEEQSDEMKRILAQRQRNLENRMTEEFLQYGKSDYGAVQNRSTIAAGVFENKQKSNDNVKQANIKQSYKAGERVHHASYGNGTIIKVTEMAGDMLVEIKFDKVAANKKVMANFAKLTDEK